MARLITARYAFNLREVMNASGRLVSESQQRFIGKDPKRSLVAALSFLVAIQIEGFQNAFPAGSNDWAPRI